MLPEQHDSADGPAEHEAARKPKVEYVGAPTEYADAEEVPEAISFIAKIFAGGILTWMVIAAIIGFTFTVCVICAATAFGSWAIFGG